MSRTELSNFSYTNKDFSDIFTELLDYVKTVSNTWEPSSSNESDPGVVLLKCIAFIGDKLNYNIDTSILETFPSTVSQIENAWNLFKSLGYNMHWYQSSKTTITVRCASVFDDDTTEITIPKFSKVCDDSLSTIFTTTHPMTFTSSSRIATCEVIEGTIEQLSINGSTEIHLSDLDSKNRIFLPDYNVADNGIFIRNIGFSNEDEWIKVDNINSQTSSSRCYEFGVDIESNLCYLKFNDGLSNIIGDGLEIFYTKSSGKAGNIKPFLLTKFYDSSINDVDVSEDYFTISNSSSSSGGEDIETIDNAYLNYKKSVNICDTLVTTEDVKNYLSLSNVGSCIVSESYDNNLFQSLDIQCINASDNLFTQHTDFYEVRSQSASRTSTNGYILPYQLRIVATPKVSFDKNITKTNYDSAFCMKHATDMTCSSSIKSVLDKKKHLSMTFAKDHDTLHSTNTPAFIIDVPVSVTIVPTKTLSTESKSELIALIKETLYETYNPTTLNCGDEITYDSVYSTIKNCSSLIKSVILYPLSPTVHFIKDLKTLASDNVYTNDITTQIVPSTLKV